MSSTYRRKPHRGSRLYRSLRGNKKKKELTDCEVGSKKYEQLKKDFTECKADSIPYPMDQSEFEIQSYIYTQLRASGHDVRGEVTTKFKKCRFDLILYVDKVAKEIIEIKKDGNHVSEEQNMKYNCYNLPIRYIRGMDDAMNYILSLEFSPAS